MERRNIVFPIYTYRILNKNSRSTLHSEEFKKKYGTLYSEFKLNSFWTRNYLLILISRRILLCVCLVYLHDHPSIQISLTMTITLIVLVFLMMNRPYEARGYNLIESVCEMLMLSGQAVTAYYYYAEIDPSDATNLGWIVISLYSSILAIHAIIMLVGFVVGIFLIIKKCCEKRNTAEVSPDRDRVTKFEETSVHLSEADVVNETQSYDIKN